MKFNVEITEIGAMVQELMTESDCLIIYNDTVADVDLREISVTHTVDELKEDVCVGDTVLIGEIEYKVTSVGDVAQKTLRQLGHCTIKFDGADEVNLPGELHLEGKMPSLKVGDFITIK